MTSITRSAKRSLGQNFLIDENVQRKVVAAVGAGLGDEVIEIGPGRGALTKHLLENVGSLILIELDDVLVEKLKPICNKRTNVSVIHGDILKKSLAKLTPDPSRALVVGNIPYNITTPIIFHLLARPRPKQIVLMIQDDVANRIVADVGTKKYGALSVGVRTVAQVERLFKVGRQAFRPVPGVDSAVIRITPNVPSRMSEFEEKKLRRLVRAAFQWRRKKLRRILRDHSDLGYSSEAMMEASKTAGVSLDDRPERLTPIQFISLCAALPETESLSTL